MQSITSLRLYVGYSQIFSQHWTTSISSWRHVWSTIGTLKRLKCIKVDIHSSRLHRDHEGKDKLGPGGKISDKVLWPLKEITQASEFEVWITWKP